MKQQTLAIDTIAVSERTGERYIATHSSVWSERFETWKHAIRAVNARIEQDPVLCAARKAGRWDLVDQSKRAAYASGAVPPCPMPEGHCMFESPDAYGVTIETPGKG